jgi:pantothenate kinase
MPNAEEAVFRRGAAFTFDGDKYLKLVDEVRKPLGPETSTIYAPSFDHAVKDPVENDISIAPTTQVVIFEGLYTLLDREPWRKAAELMDELWFVDVPMDLAVARLVKRHVASGISPDPEHARIRVLESDMRNGKEILEYRLPVQEMIKSVEDDSWKSTNEKQVDQEEEQRPRTLRQGSLAELAESGGGL